MQKAFFVSNRDTQAPEYLEYRSILKVCKYLTNLNTIDLRSMEIIDVDKFIYIYYASDDNDIQFRTDMNIFRQLITSPFFHVQSCLFIFVNISNIELCNDIVNSACRDSYISKDRGNLEIIHHSGQLILNDLASYITGVSNGNDTTSTFKTVYITETDVKEKIRFNNEYTGLDHILPKLTDMAEAYNTRVSSEALNSSRTVKEDNYVLPVIDTYSDLTTIKVSKSRCLIVTGEEFSNYNNTVRLLYNQLDSLGLKVLVLNLTSEDMNINDCDIVLTQDILRPYYPSKTISILNINKSLLGYFISNIDNIKSVDLYIILIDIDSYSNTFGILTNLCDESRIVYVIHHLEKSIKDYINLGFNVNTLFVNNNIINEDFNIIKYKELVGDTVCAYYPNLNNIIDEIEFFEFCLGGMLDVNNR